MISATHALPVNVGAPDIPVNIADIYPSQPFKCHVDRGMAPNVRGQCRVDFLTGQTFTPTMKRRGQATV
jgi:hypothetical protein